MDYMHLVKELVKLKEALEKQTNDTDFVNSMLLGFMSLYISSAGAQK